MDRAVVAGSYIIYFFSAFMCSGELQTRERRLFYWRTSEKSCETYGRARDCFSGPEEKAPLFELLGIIRREAVQKERFMTKCKQIFFCAAGILALGLLGPSHAAAAEKETIIFEREGGEVENLVAKPASTAEGEIKPVTPFHGRHETRPAGTAVLGTEIVDNKPELNVVNYASSVERKTRNELVLNTTISRVENDDALLRLADKIYNENGGSRYDIVTIFWHVGETSEPKAPWARTDIAKGETEYKILRMQMQE